MKNVVRVLGGIILAVLVGLSVTACDTGGPSGGGGGGFLTVGATEGRLTITGIEAAHSGWRVIAFGVHNGYNGYNGYEFIAAAQSISSHAVYTGGMIADGEVELNVWASVDDYTSPAYVNWSSPDFLDSELSR
ncbi:MAG: hypothetical protein FWC64_11020 [Treponema sp.]|nr:hypothetical protein [Treponema sp.]